MKGCSVAEPAPFRLPKTPTETTILAKYFRGLGDATRLRILELLSAGELTVGELVEALGQPQPKISNHLACLRWCGYVETRQEGRFVFYRLADAKVGAIIELARLLLRSNERHVELCGRIDTAG